MHRTVSTLCLKYRIVQFPIKICRFLSSVPWNTPLLQCKISLRTVLSEELKCWIRSCCHCFHWIQMLLTNLLAAYTASNRAAIESTELTTKSGWQAEILFLWARSHKAIWDWLSNLKPMLWIELNSKKSV